MSCTQYDTNHITWAKVWGNQVLGDKKGNSWIKLCKAMISCEDMTSQTDNHLGNLCCDSHCSIVLHTFSKIHNFLISYPICSNVF